MEPRRQFLAEMSRLEEEGDGGHARRIDGYGGAYLFRRDVEGEVEFVTLLWFDSMDAVREFAGEDAEASVVPAEARALLARHDERSVHYEVRNTPG
ncbi:MAG: hypothetical protein ACREK2_06165 [Gemmatimonadota bacterium]